MAAIAFFALLEALELESLNLIVSRVEPLVLNECDATQISEPVNVAFNLIL
jgi:hypothetical protein